jgi:2-iminobutanoate/2-iminopropanoate deaminase
MLRPVNPKSVPGPGFYSQGIEASAASRTLYVSGQVGVGPNGPGKDIGEQATLAIANLNAVLAEAGMNNASIAKLTIYLTDAANVPGFIEAAAGTLPATPPATTLLIVKALAAPELLVEVEAIAVG